MERETLFFSSVPSFFANAQALLLFLAVDKDIEILPIGLFIPSLVALSLLTIAG